MNSSSSHEGSALRSFDQTTGDATWRLVRANKVLHLPPCDIRPCLAKAILVSVH